MRRSIVLSLSLRLAFPGVLFVIKLKAYDERSTFGVGNIRLAPNNHSSLFAALSVTKKNFYNNHTMAQVKKITRKH